jgi:hypothetical protein
MSYVLQLQDGLISGLNDELLQDFNRTMRPPPQPTLEAAAKLEDIIKVPPQHAK